MALTRMRQLMATLMPKAHVAASSRPRGGVCGCLGGKALFPCAWSTADLDIPVDLVHSHGAHMSIAVKDFLKKIIRLKIINPLADVSMAQKLIFLQKINSTKSEFFPFLHFM